MTPPPDLSFWPLPLLLIGGIAWFTVNRLVFRDALSPFAILFVAWVAPLFLQATNLSLLETSWQPHSVLLVAWVTFALAATCLLAGWFVPRSRSIDKQGSAFDVFPLRLPAVLAAFFACYAIAFGAYLYTEFLTNPVGVPLLAMLGGDAVPTFAVHRWGKDSRWAAVTALLFVLTPVAYLAARTNRDRPWLARFLLLLAFVYPTMGVLKLSRSDVFVGGINLLLAAAYARRYAPHRPRRRSALRYVVIAGASVALYYTMMTVRIGGAAAEDLYARAIGFRSHGPLRGPAAAVYGYAAMPFENLHRFLEAHPWSAWHPGVSVTRPFLSVTGHGDLADRLDSEIRYVTPATFAAGSATFLTGVYAEAGLAGAAAVPIVYALLVNAVYLRMRRRPTLANVLLYANFVYPWVWLFFNNGFGVLGIYLNAAFIVLLGRLFEELESTRSVRLAPAPV